MFRIERSTIGREHDRKDAQGIQISPSLESRKFAWTDSAITLAWIQAVPSK